MRFKSRICPWSGPSGFRGLWSRSGLWRVCSQILREPASAGPHSRIPILITRDRGKKAHRGRVTTEAQWSAPALRHGKSIWSFRSFHSIRFCPDNRYHRILLPPYVLFCPLSTHPRTWRHPTARLAILGYYLPQWRK